MWSSQSDVTAMSSGVRSIVINGERKVKGEGGVVLGLGLHERVIDQIHPGDDKVIGLKESIDAERAHSLVDYHATYGSGSMFCN